MDWHRHEIYLSAQKNFTARLPAATVAAMALKSSYDVIVAGAGHNGLTAAAYLFNFIKSKVFV